MDVREKLVELLQVDLRCRFLNRRRMPDNG